ncbi:MAG: hypothetical protein M3P23_00700 [Actinomycetota bacterium]|nr:hypothetical protein [Actinomycetota bacterium]
MEPDWITGGMLPKGCAGEVEVPEGVCVGVDELVDEPVDELVDELVDVAEPDGSSVVELDGLGELVSSALDVLLEELLLLGSAADVLVLLGSAAELVDVPLGVSSASAGALNTAERSNPVAAAIAAPRRPFRPALTSCTASLGFPPVRPARQLTFALPGPQRKPHNAQPLSGKSHLRGPEYLRLVNVRLR